MPPSNESQNQSNDRSRNTTGGTGTVEDLVTLAQALLESRGYRVVQVAESKAAKDALAVESGQAADSIAAENAAIAAFKQAANDYVSDQDPEPTERRGR